MNESEINLDNLPLVEALRFAHEGSTTGGLLTHAALKTLAAGCRELTAARAEIEAVTEQRDEARRLAEKYRNLSCDSQDDADETLLPWETTNPNEL
jgi:hypothetical protein